MSKVGSPRRRQIVGIVGGRAPPGPESRSRQAEGPAPRSRRTSGVKKPDPALMTRIRCLTEEGSRMAAGALVASLSLDPL